jgi:hypothetical protein
VVQKSAKCHLLTWPRKAPARTVLVCKRQFAGAPVDAGYSDGENLALPALKTPFGDSRRAGSLGGRSPTRTTANGFESLAEGIGAHCHRFDLLDDNIPAADNCGGAALLPLPAQVTAFKGFSCRMLCELRS